MTISIIKHQLVILFNTGCSLETKLKDLDHDILFIIRYVLSLFNSVYRNALFLNESHLSNETISLIDISKPSKFD